MGGRPALNSFKIWDHILQKEQGRKDQPVICFKGWELTLREEIQPLLWGTLSQGKEFIKSTPNDAMQNLLSFTFQV